MAGKEREMEKKKKKNLFCPKLGKNCMEEWCAWYCSTPGECAIIKIAHNLKNLNLLSEAVIYSVTERARPV